MLAVIKLEIIYNKLFTHRYDSSGSSDGLKYSFDGR